MVTMMVASGGGSYVIAWGAIAVGVSRLVRGYAMPQKAPSAEWTEQMEGRDGPEDPTPQIAGAKCVHCGGKITSGLEARPCKQCGEPVHHDCRKDHRTDAHGRPPRAAYR
jgi:hypothetical protein